MLQFFLENLTQLINIAASESPIHEQCKQIIDENISAVKTFVTDRIQTVNTSYRRKKNLQKSSNFVTPVDKAVGLKWHTKQNLETILPDHTIKQATFQYVPILKTLQSLFTQPDIKKEYFDYNLDESHICQAGIYERFCCSTTHKKMQLIQG